MSTGNRKGDTAMTARATFLAIMAGRRQFPKGSADHEYRTKAARKLVWIIKGRPVNEWEN
jgi:hypothetical protein